MDYYADQRASDGITVRTRDNEIIARCASWDWAKSIADAMNAKFWDGRLRA